VVRRVVERVEKEVYGQVMVYIGLARCVVERDF